MKGSDLAQLSRFHIAHRKPSMGQHLTLPDSTDSTSAATSPCVTDKETSPLLSASSRPATQGSRPSGLPISVQLQPPPARGCTWSWSDLKPTRKVSRILVNVIVLLAIFLAAAAFILTWISLFANVAYAENTPADGIVVDVSDQLSTSDSHVCFVTVRYQSFAGITHDATLQLYNPVDGCVQALKGTPYPVCYDYDRPRDAKLGPCTWIDRNVGFPLRRGTNIILISMAVWMVCPFIAMFGIFALE